MDFNKQTIKYIGKNFFKLLPFAVIPALAFAFSGSFSTVVTFFFSFNLRTLSVWTIFSSFTFFGSYSWTIGLLSMLVFMFFASLIFGAIHRHMKFGKFSYRKPIETLNETVMVVVPFIILVTIIEELTAFVIAILTNFLAILFVNSAVWISLIIVVAIYYGMLLLIGQFLLLVPSVVVAGYSLIDGTVYASKLISGRSNKIALDFFTLMIPIMTISTIVSVFIDINSVQIIVDAILNLIFIMYSISYILVAYYDLTGEERQDLITSRKNYLT